eukprot:1478207-Pleurochrysis_carterae.AAC.1
MQTAMDSSRKLTILIVYSNSYIEPASRYAIHSASVQMISANINIQGIDGIRARATIATRAFCLVQITLSPMMQSV